MIRRRVFAALVLAVLALTWPAVTGAPGNGAQAVALVLAVLATIVAAGPHRPKGNRRAPSQTAPR